MDHKVNETQKILDDLYFFSSYKICWVGFKSSTCKRQQNVSFDKYEVLNTKDDNFVFLLVIFLLIHKVNKLKSKYLFKKFIFLIIKIFKKEENQKFKNYKLNIFEFLIWTWLRIKDSNFIKLKLFFFFEWFINSPKFLDLP